MMYGDIIVNVANQVRPYEVNAGETDAMIDAWSHQLVSGLSRQGHEPRPDAQDFCRDLR